MSEEHDRLFIQRFSLVLAGLIAFTLVIIAIALSIHSRMDLGENPARVAAREARIQPVAGVYAGETGRAAAQEAAAARAAERGVAFDGSTDGAMIYEQVCAACHDTGTADSPVLERSAWEDRLGKGRDELIATAIEGMGAMPPKGGRSDLSEEQVAATVDYMLDQLE